MEHNQTQERSLPMPPAVASLVQTLEQAGWETWAVGGCVRDSLLGRVPHDWDLTTAARPEQLLALLPEAIPTGIAHGTVSVPTPAGLVEVTTFRTEGGYADHRRPDRVAFVTQLAGDLARRDFTVNAMAWHPARGLRDPFDGRGDLQRRRIRCVGDPARRFAEDALRMLRALRFAARLGFALEPDTAAALTVHAPELRYVAAERVYEELRGLLAADGQALAEEYPAVLAAATAQLRLPGTRRALRTWRTQLGDAGVGILLDWCERYGGQDTSAARAWLAQLQQAEQPLDIDGRALMALGIPPGPAMGALLTRLRAAVAAGEVDNHRAALADWVRAHGS